MASYHHLTRKGPTRRSQPCHAHFLLALLLTETVQHPFLKHAFKKTQSRNLSKNGVDFVARDFSLYVTFIIS